MRLLCLLVLGMLVCSCAHKKGNSQRGIANDPRFSSPSPPNTKLIVLPDDNLVGKVARVDQGQGFVVLNFPIGHLPPMQQRFNLYRHGFKVGEVRITGPQFDDNIVADLLAGDSEVGDEARKD